MAGCAGGKHHTRNVGQMHACMTASWQAREHHIQQLKQATLKLKFKRHPGTDIDFFLTLKRLFIDNADRLVIIKIIKTYMKL